MKAVACGDLALVCASMQHGQWHFVAIQYCHMQGIYMEASMSRYVACSDMMCNDYGHDKVDDTLASLEQDWSK
jgi:hypothetical protein